MSSRKSTLSSSFRYSTGSLNRSTGSTTTVHHQSRRDEIAKKLAKKTCMCSPTTHPGSFRCSLHKNMMMTSSNSPARLNIRRSAMANSLLRMATNTLGEGGDRVKRALAAALIRPSSHHQRRMSVFQPKPSRLSIMSNANDDDDGL